MGGRNRANEKISTKGIRMTKIIGIIFSLCYLHCTFPASPTCTCLFNNNADLLCYIGSLDLSQTPESKQLSLYYNGNIIKVSNGVFCFKENKNVAKLNYLFINPELMQISNDGDNITSLELVKNATYHLYRFKKLATQTLQKEPIIEWNIKQKTMPTKILKGLTHHIIPDRTLIIPLDASFFQQKNGIITFKYDPLKGRTTIVKLPAPVTLSSKNEAFKEAIVHAHLCIMNLKNFHTPQEVKKIRMDNHTLIQESQ
jgi:hypothetical protein